MYDFAIIGSGVSGGRMAYELCRGGAHCVLVEAGPSLDRRTFPSSEMEGQARLFWNGGAELTRDGRLGLLRARCLGGTSVVNQALLDRFDDDAFDDWRARSGVDWLRREVMAADYERVEQDLSIAQIPPEHRNRNAELFARGFARKGLHCAPLERGQGDCRLDRGSDCIVCLNGCPRDSKQSALVTTIHRARQHGLVIEADLEVERVIPGGEQVCVLGRRGDDRHEILARHAVLAGGALGTTGLLLRSGLGQGLPALGTRFSCHPQLMTYARFDEPVDAHKGALQAYKSADPALRARGYKFENVFAGPIATAMLLPGLGVRHGAVMAQYRYLASMEVAIRDDATGTIRLDTHDRPLVDKRLTAADRRKIREGLDLVAEIFADLGAREVIRCDQAFGLHLMGGCPFGTDRASSVVGPDFRVHGHPELIVADSSVFPSAPGINPSLTILALSARAGRQLVA